MTQKGKRCEAIIRRVGRNLEAHDVAKLWKWPEEKRIQTVPTRCPSCSAWIKGKALQHTEKTGCDFFGYTRSGRVILIECKETDKPRLVLGATGLKPHQFYALYDAHRAGGIALLAWLHDDLVGVLDVDMIQEISHGRKSIPWKPIPDRFKHLEVEFDSMLEPWISVKSDAHK